MKKTKSKSIYTGKPLPKMSNCHTVSDLRKVLEAYPDEMPLEMRGNSVSVFPVNVGDETEFLNISEDDWS